VIDKITKVDCLVNIWKKFGEFTKNGLSGGVNGVKEVKKEYVTLTWWLTLNM
jgi:hypothetical protein